ncbi:restriction endonuclease subunit S [Leyella stercorea]|uniref:restriction endonuclease subunit S n=1 Tax=Leyella stercorea TaxID=363265 RepID=UPI003AAE8F1E
MPEGWCWTTLGEICCIKGGKRIPRGMTFAKGKTAHVYIRVTDMKDNTIKLSDLKYIDDYVYEHIKNYTINASDLYLTIAGTIGSVGIVPNEVDGMNLTENAAKLTQIGCIKEYLLYALLSTIAQEHFISRFHQVAQPKLSIETASKTPIAMPPIGEQNRIVKEIKRYLAAIKIIEEGQTDLETTISQAKSKILDLAIHGKLVPQDPTDEPAAKLLKRINPKAEIACDNGHYQKLPEGWAITPMQTLCALVDGEKQNGIERINLDVKYLRGEREAKVLTSGKYTAAKTLLILVDGENSGEVFRAPVDGYQGSTFKQLPIHEEMYTDYVLQVINLHRKTLRENKVGSAIPHLNKKLFKAINVPIPPYEEQKRIVNAINQTFTILDTIMENL